MFERVINLSVKVYPLHDEQLIGSSTKLPDFLLESRSVKCLQKGLNGKPFTKTDCVFRYMKLLCVSFVKTEI